MFAFKRYLVMNAKKMKNCISKGKFFILFDTLYPKN